MHHALGVYMGKRVREVRAQLPDHGRRHRPAGDLVAQRLPVDELQHDERDLVADPRVVDAHQPRMGQPRQSVDLVGEPAAAGVVRCGPEQLDRHEAMQLRVPRPVHLGHSARAKDPGQLVLAVQKVLAGR
jgi:hypothetical protein